MLPSRSSTRVTATLSLAVALQTTVPVMKAPLAGAVSDTVGGVTSDATVTLTVAESFELPTVS